MSLFKQLRKEISYLEEAQIAEIYEAFLVAQDAHSGQKRDNGENYLTHPIAVATVLASMHMDHQSIAAALLHDVVEDTAVTKEFITSKFGNTVADLVDGVTKLTQIEFSGSHAETQAESFRKMVLAMSRDIRVILIKLADRLHNMRTIGGVVANKGKRISRETLDIYAPIANRLGMHALCLELETLAFTILYPRRHRILLEAVEKARGNRKEVMATIEKEIKQGIAKSTLPEVTVSGREKNLYSIYRKMSTRHILFAAVMDVYAFRIIVQSIDDCYRMLGIAHSLYKPVPGKFKDYIAIPKANGYQSLHTTLFGLYGVPIEIQIRTKEMDNMANNGIAAHWLYRADDKLTNTAHIRAQQWVNNLLEMQQNTGSSLEFLDNVRVDLFPDEIYVFTPKGHIMELPRGSTVVDFAYAIHTDVGNTCVAARINHKFMPLATVLLNGQTVSIITAPDAKPNPAWLNFVITARARSSIRAYLKDQKYSESVQFGKQLLEQALAEMSMPLQQFDQKAIDALLEETQFKTLDDLYESIGLGKRLAIFTAHQLANAAQPEIKIDDDKNKPLLIRDAEGMAITFAPCCNPIPGDQIVGYFNVGHGLVVHTENCATLEKLRKQRGQYMPVLWADDVTGDFKAVVNVEMANQKGALAQLASAVADAGSNIDDIKMSDTNEDYSLVTIRLVVKNVAHLERVLRHISQVPMVMGVIRKKQ